MKIISIMLRLECRDDISPGMIKTICANVQEHVEHEFGSDYDDWNDRDDPDYEEAPLVADDCSAYDIFPDYGSVHAAELTLTPAQQQGLTSIMNALASRELTDDAMTIRRQLAARGVCADHERA